MANHPIDGVPLTIKGLPGYPWHGSDIERQLGYLYGNLDQTLGQLSSSLHRTMKINSYHINPPDIDMALRVRKKWFDAETPPPSTLVLARELPMHGPTVLIDMITLADNAELDRKAEAARGIAQWDEAERRLSLSAADADAAGAVVSAASASGSTTSTSPSSSSLPSSSVSGSSARRASSSRCSSSSR